MPYNWILLLLIPTLFSNAARLVDFQVAQPPPLPKDAKQCTIQILEYAAASTWMFLVELT